MSVGGATRTTSAGPRSAWFAGIVFVIAVVAESVVGATGIKLTQNDSAAKIASRLNEHRGLVLAVAYLSVVYAIAFVIYVWRLYDLLRQDTEERSSMASLVLVGGVLFVTLHAVSDIGITGCSAQSSPPTATSTIPGCRTPFTC